MKLRSLLMKKNLLNTLKKYIENQMQIGKKYIKCISPNCPYYFNRIYSEFCNVGHFSCGNYFGLNCQQNDHSHLKCDQNNEWAILSQKMRQLNNDQQKWEKRELSLWNYRKKNILMK